MEEFQLGEVPQAIHEFLWDEFCDWYIETSKFRLTDKDSITPAPVLTHVLETTLRLLHPSMPFITEEIWQNLKSRLFDDDLDCPSIVVAEYPEADYSLLDKEAEKTFEVIMNIVRAIRNIRAEFRINPSQYLDIIIEAGHLKSILQSESRNIRSVARVSKLKFAEGPTETLAKTSVTAFVGTVAIYVPLTDLVDFERERLRLESESRETISKINQLNERLGDTKFTQRAPDDVVERERNRLEELQVRYQRIEQTLTQIPT
jgi:valyl-tRNA synthetase